jgi:hypothetical protein
MMSAAVALGVRRPTSQRPSSSPAARKVVKSPRTRQAGGRGPNGPPTRKTVWWKLGQVWTKIPFGPSANRRPQHDAMTTGRNYCCHPHSPVAETADCTAREKDQQNRAYFGGKNSSPRATPHSRTHSVGGDLYKMVLAITDDDAFEA